MKPKLLKLSQIVTTAGTQIRAKIDADTVDEYATAMQDATNTFPPVVVFHDGNQYILADGFHRVMAAVRNGFKDIKVEINKGTKSDALKYALGANSSHGLKRSNSDKRRSVELALAEWPKLSDREISRICCVDNSTVSKIHNELLESNSCENAETRIGADGKERKMPAPKASTKPVKTPEVKPDKPIKTIPVEQDFVEREKERLETQEKSEAEKLIDGLQYVIGLIREYQTPKPDDDWPFIDWSEAKNILISTASKLKNLS